MKLNRALALSLVIVGLTACSQEPIVSSPYGQIEGKASSPLVLRVRGQDFVVFSHQEANGTRAELYDSTETRLLASVVSDESSGTVRYAHTVSKTALSGSLEGKRLGQAEAAAALMFYYRNAEAAAQLTDAGKQQQAPGCDLFPDLLEIQCIRDCCDAHDLCYQQNNCNALSWLGLGSQACRDCNTKVLICFATCGLELLIDAWNLVVDWITGH